MKAEQKPTYHPIYPRYILYLATNVRKKLTKKTKFGWINWTPVYCLFYFILGSDHLLLYLILDNFSENIKSVIFCCSVHFMELS